MATGFIDVVSTEFALGWVADPHAGPVPPILFAQLGEEVLGWSVARFERKDLPDGAGYVVPFTRRLTQTEMAAVSVRLARTGQALTRANKLRHEVEEPLQIFVVGSPRSGTSQLGACLSSAYALRWLGEGHGAALLAGAWTALRSAPPSPSHLGKVVANLELGGAVLHATREAYYFAHSSSRFLDKTPGIGMIRACPMLAAAFPGAFFIFARRNGVSNVLSRAVKFGGGFESHCRDWSGAMLAWREVREEIERKLEIEQEEMLAHPVAIANRVSAFVGLPELAGAVADNLGSRAEERTGAGIGRTRLSETGWNVSQAMVFVDICGPMMRAYGYPIAL